MVREFSEEAAIVIPADRWAHRAALRATDGSYRIDCYVVDLVREEARACEATTEEDVLWFTLGMVRSGSFVLADHLEWLLRLHDPQSLACRQAPPNSGLVFAGGVS